MKTPPRLYAIADASFGNPVEISLELFAGGAQWVQVRNKTASGRQLMDQVEKILAIAPVNSAVIVNDRVDVARITGAAGVHLGQMDLPATAAREILGTDSIVGISTHNLDQALRAEMLPVDYVAVGPIFPSGTKSNPDPVVGIMALTEICSAVHKPVVAIGGITLANVAQVFAAGAKSAATISGLLGTRDIVARTREWIGAC